MVSLERFVKLLKTFACLGLFFTATVYVAAKTNADQTTPMKECEGSYESKVSCKRTLGDGSTQTGSGWCKCSRGKLSGGCRLPAATYTEKQYNLSGTQCRTCTMPAVTKGCGGMSHMVDETPSCGEWSSCGNDIPPALECIVGLKEYKPKGNCGTSERTCCSGGTWSDWDKACPTTPNITIYQCQVVPNKYGNFIWIGGAPDSTPAANLYADVRYTLTFEEGSFKGNTILEFPAGSRQSQSKEFSVESFCSGCALLDCTARLGGTSY